MDLINWWTYDRLKCGRKFVDNIMQNQVVSFTLMCVTIVCWRYVFQEEFNIIHKNFYLHSIFFLPKCYDCVIHVWSTLRLVKILFMRPLLLAVYKKKNILSQQIFFVAFYVTFDATVFSRLGANVSLAKLHNILNIYIRFRSHQDKTKTN